MAWLLEEDLEKWDEHWMPVSLRCRQSYHQKQPELVHQGLPTAIPICHKVRELGWGVASLAAQVNTSVSPIKLTLQPTVWESEKTSGRPWSFPGRTRVQGELEASRQATWTSCQRRSCSSFSTRSPPTSPCLGTTSRTNTRSQPEEMAVKIMSNEFESINYFQLIYFLFPHSLFMKAIKTRQCKKGQKSWERPQVNLPFESLTFPPVMKSPLEKRRRFSWSCCWSWKVLISDFSW